MSEPRTSKWTWSKIISNPLIITAIVSGTTLTFLTVAAFVSKLNGNRDRSVPWSLKNKIEVETRFIVSWLTTLKKKYLPKGKSSNQDSIRPFKENAEKEIWSQIKNKLSFTEILEAKGYLGRIETWKSLFDPTEVQEASSEDLTNIVYILVFLVLGETTKE